MGEKVEAKDASGQKLKRKSPQGSVDRRFFEQLKFILRICIPQWRSKTLAIILLHSGFLVLRTYLSVVVAKIDGRLVKNLVAANKKEFLVGLGYWFLIALPATYTNSMIRYCQSKLAIALRTSLVKYVQDLYLSERTYYKAQNLDNRLEGVDQLITTDITRWTNALSSLYSNLGKPILDIVIFNYQLGKNIGSTGMVGLALNYMVTAVLLRAATPNFGRMAAEEARLEGEYRMVHSRIITNAEEIAFYQGPQRELGILNAAYRRLIRHINRIYKIRIAYNMFEDFMIKYCWSAVGLVLSAIPVFYPKYAGARLRRQEALLASQAATESPDAVKCGKDVQTGSRTQGYITNKRLMMSLADAGGRIMYSYKELSELAGYTSRVHNLITTLQDLHSGKYRCPSADSNAPYRLDDLKGVQHVNDKGLVSFESVPVVTPTGDVLVENLTFNVQRGSHLMIMGPNGSGKTSILRILAGLWPLFRGKLTVPPARLDSIMYIPQRPYLSLGTLREQIIYPHSEHDMREANRSDSELLAILKKVYLAYIPDREGGLDVVKEWKDVFSGGEKQRMQLARLFYHRPEFAVLDECTSAVSSDVEGLLYNGAKDDGMTVITISHRPALLKYHNFLLRIGEGQEGHSWSLEKLGNSESVAGSVKGEIKQIEAQLKDASKWKARLEAINRELNLQIKVGAGGKTESEGTLKHAKRTLV